MQKTTSGRFNLNEIPRSMLANQEHYSGQEIPTVTGRFRYAGALFEQAKNYPYYEAKLPTMRRQVRPHGVY